MKKRIVTFLFVAMCFFTSPVLFYFATLPSSNWEKDGSETTALALALYYESALAEPEEGIRAVYHVIDNRVKSKNFPDSIREVVVQGAEPGKKSGCQFSFVCDGEAEHPQKLCELHPKYTSDNGPFFCERRWVEMYFRAVVYRTLGTSGDPTCGATLYYTGKAPYWVGDFVPGTVQKIGSHTFGQSRFVGRDVAVAGCTNNT
jgi:spore germination cell wall hydrolase CwlJ-like protein